MNLKKRQLTQSISNQYTIPSTVKYSRFYFNEGSGATITDHGSNGIGDMTVSGGTGVEWSNEPGWFTPITAVYIDNAESASIDALMNLNTLTTGGIFGLFRVRFDAEHTAEKRLLWHGGYAADGFIQFNVYRQSAGVFRAQINIKQNDQTAVVSNADVAIGSGDTQIAAGDNVCLMFGVDIGTGQCFVMVQDLDKPQAAASDYDSLVTAEGSYWSNNADEGGLTMFTTSEPSNPSTGTFNDGAQNFRVRDMLLVRTENEIFSKRAVIIDQFTKGGAYDAYPFMNDL